MIRSVRVILCRTLLGVLDDRGINIYAVAQSTFISSVDLRRLIEFGSPLEAQAAERLITWGTRMIVVSQPKKPTPHQISTNPRTRSHGPIAVRPF